ncbi:MAG TPA: FG-GAP-like repeat-containing protein [Tepidisphaeraceae bacterium]|jgi:tetratricopeptide (TPR) repeat protein|nr:FG-GAP-like repeat-containing protein [Tepidisphaeraceae bacterium]
MPFCQPRICRLIISMILVAVGGCKKPKQIAPPTAPAPTSDWIAQNNRGVGLMGQFDFDGAVRAFRPIAIGSDQRLDAQVNLGIALLNRRGEGDAAHAASIFNSVLAKAPENLPSAYCLGLLRINDGKPAEALAEFQQVLKVDPADAYAEYFSGQCLAMQNKYAEAVTRYESAARLDPLLRSADYGEFQSLQQLGKKDQADARLAEFQRLADDPRAALAEFKYTRMGKKAEAIAIDLAPASSPPPAGALFARPQPLKILNDPGVIWRKDDGAEPRPTITAADIDGDGKVDLFISSALEVNGKLRNAVLLQRDGGFELDLKSPLSSVTDINAVVWADFDNDGFTDVYFCRHGANQLFRQISRGNWQDITESAHASGGDFNTVDAVAVDADHDGDLDLVLVRSDGPTELLNNNLDGTFSAIGEKAGIGGDGRPAVGIVAADLNHDGLVDLMVIKKTPPNEVFINDGVWKYHRDAKFGLLEKDSMSAAVAADADANGRVSIFCIHRGVIERFVQSADGNWTSGNLAMRAQADFADHKREPIFTAHGPIAVADITGNGTLHVMAANAGGWFALPATQGAGSPFAPSTGFITWTLANLERWAGPSIAGLPINGGPPVVWSPGPGRFGFAALSLSGKTSKSESMRSNASGIGVTIAGRFDSHWAVTSTYRRQSGPGQSLQPISIGAGAGKQLDFVRLTWPDGLQQTELSIPAGKLTHIAEVQRQTSSCPVIFAWDGKQFSFVTDCLGGGGIGFATGPNEYAPQRPVENVMLPAGLPREKDGRLVVKIGEPMEEACYLDSAALASYDLPPGWMMTLDERMAVNDPQPTGEPRFYRKLLLPSHAVNDRGEDVTEAVVKIDGVAAEPGARDSRFIGFTKEHFVEMTFDRAIDDMVPKSAVRDDNVGAGKSGAGKSLAEGLTFGVAKTGRDVIESTRYFDAGYQVLRRAGSGTGRPDSSEYLRIGVEAKSFSNDARIHPVADIGAAPPKAELLLLADGWIEYPYSQTMFAAWQAKALYRAPTLEACGGDGKWVTVLKEFGYPAGMPRQMSVAIPLDKLPPGTTRLRIRTDQEIYWDRLALAWAEPCPQAVRKIHPMKSAMLADVGFPFRTTGPQRQPHYDYSRRLPLWDTRHQTGWYTAFGSVEELLGATDDACAIFGPGEEVELQYQAPSAPPPAGWTRKYVLALAGWCKDRDLYTKDGRTIEPLPERDGATAETRRKRDELYRKYNTRFAP